ncbi:hypothetical protein GP486_000561 [Trichoglossum hirsutum]|uniref:Translin n=1 Tax=Trichoglossum hirsutum TaxID=265104 RepID=A0A9P8RTF7_9PEZI|nr:hypothetical protein GP486_000561 [Trichoglossum hirsutum]
MPEAGEAQSTGTASADGPFIPMFEAFRDELNDHYDRRERIFKTARDITALSKKMYRASSPILLLWLYMLTSSAEFFHFKGRTRMEPFPNRVAVETEKQLAAVDGLFHSLSEDLCGINSWRYQRQISSGIQEYIEAISLQRYLQSQALITPEEASASIVGGVQLTEEDYIMGIFDLVGELMRFGITAMATTGSLPGDQMSGLISEDDPDVSDQQKLPKSNILTDLRSLRSCFETLNTLSSDGHFARHFSRKSEVMRKCVEKVESAVYGIIVRGRERPKGWVPDVLGAGFRGSGRDSSDDLTLPV